MNFSLISLFTLTYQGLEASILGIIAHTLISVSLFASVGIIYERSHHKNVLELSGLLMTMPVFSFFFLYFIFCTIGIPFTIGFYVDVLMAISVYLTNSFFLIVLLFSTSLTLIYSI